MMFWFFCFVLFKCLFAYFILFIYFIYLFFGCVGSSLLCAGFLQLRQAGATLRYGARASHCGGFSCCGAQALGMWASVVVAHRLSSCGSRAQLLHSMWDLPGPGIKPVTPALAGGFLTTVPPGKSLYDVFENYFGMLLFFIQQYHFVYIQNAFTPFYLGNTSQLTSHL